MTIEYQQIESDIRGYQGVSLDEATFKGYLSGAVKDILLDREEQDILLESLVSLQTDTGFSSSKDLEADIQGLENQTVDVQNFRIGEAFAEAMLETNYQCRFHWNELRDARNPKGNKTGADLVGFIEINNQVLFLWGEVKTSSETKTIPPQVMTKPGEMEDQLNDLYTNNQKRLILISYLQNKARWYGDEHPFKMDFMQALQNYYDQFQRYQLMGVLVRDVSPNERDISVSYQKLSRDIEEPIGLKLLALYVPVTQDSWLSIINGEETE